MSPHCIICMSTYSTLGQYHAMKLSIDKTCNNKLVVVQCLDGDPIEC